MARRGADVLGIDLAAKPLKVAQLHAIEAATPRIAYREVAAEALAEEMPEGFDVVTCMEMLEHVPDPGSIVAACGRLVKPAGGRSSRRSTATPRRSSSRSSAPSMC
jgi:2-polyprenyl-6-hydroxyphenyl methylase/3-demethylubiquinone-9 3-methyltransferase